MKIRQPAIAVLLLVALAGCGPRAKICPQRLGYSDAAPKEQVWAMVVVNECTEKGPNNISVVVFQTGAEMQMNSHLRVVTAKDKSEGKALRKSGAPFLTFQWQPDGVLEVFHDEKAELVNPRKDIEGGAIKPMKAKFTPVHCYKEDEEIPSTVDRRSPGMCLPEKP